MTSNRSNGGNEFSQMRSLPHFLVSRRSGRLALASDYEHTRQRSLRNQQSPASAPERLPYLLDVADRQQVGISGGQIFTKGKENKRETKHSIGRKISKPRRNDASADAALPKKAQYAPTPAATPGRARLETPRISSRRSRRARRAPRPLRLRRRASLTPPPEKADTCPGAQPRLRAIPRSGSPQTRRSRRRWH